MKVLFANARRLSPFGVGGDTVSLEIIFNFLSLKWECLALGTLSHPDYLNFDENLTEKLNKMKIPFRWEINFLDTKYNFNNFRPQLVFNKKLYFYKKYQSVLVPRVFLLKEAERFIISFKPEIVFTQLDASYDIINLTNKYRIPTVLFIHDVEKMTFYNLKKIKKWKNLYVIFPSFFTKNKLIFLIKCLHSVVYPACDKKKYFIKRKNRLGEFITMINPVREKGARTIYNIIKQLPEKNFLLVEGWQRFKDLKYNFKQFKNVTLIPRQDDMEKVYRQTKILLIPSVWEECFARVAIEAESNSIPVIASYIGGLKEAVGKGGILIKDYLNTSKWIEKIKELDESKNKYKLLSLQALKHASKFSSDKICKEIINICNFMVKQKEI